MANLIEITNIPATRFVPVTSRYADSFVIYYTENKFLTFNTYKKQDLLVSDQDKFAVISKGVEFRPDLVSQKVYGTPDFWWKIMEVNNIKDIFDFKVGTNIRIPERIF
jgi:hypothetical protein